MNGVVAMARDGLPEGKRGGGVGGGGVNGRGAEREAEPEECL